MALPAGRRGVHPDMVDEDGYINFPPVPTVPIKTIQLEGELPLLPDSSGKVIIPKATMTSRGVLKTSETGSVTTIDTSGYTWAETTENTKQSSIPSGTAFSVSIALGNESTVKIKGLDNAFDGCAAVVKVTSYSISGSGINVSVKFAWVSPDGYNYKCILDGLFNIIKIEKVV